MSRLVATEIKWDIDNESDVKLPETINIPDEIVDEDEISDYLSEQTGYCHKGFCLKVE